MDSEVLLQDLNVYKCRYVLKSIIVEIVKL